MRFSIAGVLALVTSVIAEVSSDFAVIYKPARNEKIPVGTPYNITWKSDTAKYAGKSIKISLSGGTSGTTMQALKVITDNIPHDARTYQWTPSEDLLGRALYGLHITLVDDPKKEQWSDAFQIVKAGTEPSSSSATTSSAAAVTTAHGTSVATAAAACT